MKEEKTFIQEKEKTFALNIKSFILGTEKLLSSIVSEKFSVSMREI